MTKSKNSATLPNLFLIATALGLLSLELSGWGIQGLLQRRTQLETDRQQLLEAQQTQVAVERRRNAPIITLGKIRVWLDGKHGDGQQR